MSSWSNVTVTAKGYALQSKLTASGKGLVITKAVGGSGRVVAGQLVNQTAVSNPVQVLQVESLTYDSANENASLKVLLTNYELQNGYTLNQIGIYATDPDEGEILYALAQVDTGEPIPSIVSQPSGYSCEWDFRLIFTNSENVSITIDPNTFLTASSADQRYATKEEFEELKDTIGNSSSVVIVPVGEQIPVEERDKNSIYFIVSETIE